MATVLIVDDRETDRELLVTLLQHVRHRVIEAADGLEALHMARAERPDLVISDVLLPKMDGYELVRRMRDDPAVARIPVIFYTAVFNETEARELAHDLGVERILAKPADPKTILNVVADVLGGGGIREIAPLPGQFELRHQQLLTDQLLRQLDALHQSEERFRLLAENATDVIFRYNLKPAPAYSYINHAATVTLGYEPREYYADPAILDKLVHSDSKAELDRLIAEKFLPEKSMEICLLHKDGRTVWAEIHCTPIHDEQGLLIAIEGVARDVTERKVLEAQMIEAILTAKRANRAKSEFLSNMSHELRTPIAGILGMAELLAKRLNLQDAENLQYIRFIQEAGQSLNALVNEVLDFGKIEAGVLAIESEPFDLRREFQFLISMYNVQAEQQGDRLDWRIDPAIPDTMLGDAAHLEQVLRNLVSNAVKFTINGLIEIEAALHNHNGDRLDVLFSVRDTGPGIPSKEHHRVFEDYYQGDHLTKKHAGTGLGLAITRKIVLAMGGRIWLESEEGQGAAFFVQLPFRPAILEPVPDAEPPSTGPCRLPLQPLHFLVAEDNKINQIYMEAMLSDLGHRVTIAANGKIALELLAQNHFDVVLMDVQMPEMDGYTAIRLIRKLEPPLKNIPIFALTAFVSDEDADQAITAGANGHIPKPLDVNDLTRQLAGLCIKTNRQ